MTSISRRSMLHQSVALAAGTLLTARFGIATTQAARLAANKRRLFTMDLVCGAVGISADQKEAIRLAQLGHFESVAPSPGHLAQLSDSQRDELLAELKAKNLVWGAAGLPVDFRRDAATFNKGIQQLPALAKGLQQAGVTRVSTWLSPSHDELTYVGNFRQHTARLRQVAKILADHGQRFGLEYVGPKTSWTAKRHSFIHTMAETKDLIAEIGQSNVGFVLDSWHWHTAHETEQDLLTLTNKDVVACDLNDAPAGIPTDQQLDLVRELPGDTGVIDLKTFLGALIKIGYDGPVRAEPFNKVVNALDNEAATAAVSTAMQTAFALVK